MPKNPSFVKSGKTLCALFPEKNSFTVLIVLGKKEVEKLKKIPIYTTK